MSEAVVVFVCVGGNLYTFTAAGVQQTILIKHGRAKQRPCIVESTRLSPVEVEAFGEHDGLQVLVLLLLPKPLLLQEGHQGVTLLHHLQHLIQDLLLLSELLLRLQVV